MSAGSPHSRGRARILNQRIIAEGYREIHLSNDSPVIQTPRPGQFFTILPQRYPLSMMRRPFAYSDADEKGFSFIYEIRGTATRDLAHLEDGVEVDCIGPLGSSFPSPPEKSLPILIAGGIGVGPILYLARRLAADGFESLVVLGARTAALVPEINWPSSAEVRICTDDGTLGIHGTAIDGLQGMDISNGEFYSCGPHPMMAAVHRLAEESGRRCWVSMEEMMACGVGACQGCVVPIIDVGDPSRPAYKRACVEGPIFNSREISW
jgi:dihydroorotate dehydrogenase electron transfer subunit